MTTTSTPAQPAALIKPGLPELERLVIRLILLLAILLSVAAPWIEQAAALLDSAPPTMQPIVTPTGQPVASSAGQPTTVPIQHRIALLMRATNHPPILWVTTGIAAIGGLIIVLELAIAATHLVSTRRRWATYQTFYARVRPLRPQSRVSTRQGSTPGDLWHALHALDGALRTSNPHPWVTLTLGARREESATLGVQVALPPAATQQSRLKRATSRDVAPTKPLTHATDGPRQRPALMRMIESILLGADSELVLDVPIDPLAAALEPGCIVLWNDLTLTRPPHIPIRTPLANDADMLGQLAASLRTPPGIRHTEIQISIAPRRDSGSDSPWRTHARRRLIDLRKKRSWGSSDEETQLEAKTDSEAFDVSIRLVVIADPEHRATAKMLLQELRTAFGQYQQRSGGGVQRFTIAPFGSGQQIVQAPTQRRSFVRRAFSSMLPILFITGTTLLGAQQAGQVGAIIGGLIGLLVVAGSAGGYLISTQTLAIIRMRAPRIMPPIRLCLPINLWRGPIILGSGEASGIWHLPSIDLRNLVSWLPNRYLPAPRHVFAPPTSPQSPASRVILGYARTRDGQELPVGTELRALRQVMHITAGMGAGKSRTLANIAEQLIQQLHSGLLLLDGKGDDAGCLAATVRSYIPRDQEQRLMLLDLLDADWPIGLNPFYGIDLKKAGGATQALGIVLALLSRLDPELAQKSMGMVQYLQMGTILIIEGEPAPTIASLKQCLEDEAYRQRLLPHCTNLEVINFWTITFPNTSDQQKNSLNALIRRFDNLLVDETTRYLLTQPIPTIDFLTAIEQQAIVLAPMPHRTLGGMAEFTGMLLLQAIMRAAFQRPGSDQTRTTVPLIIDELQVFIGSGESTDIRDAVTQLRGFGIAGIYAHQTLVQLGTLQDEMLTNSANRCILRTQEPDASLYARQYPTTDLTPADISGQHPHEHQYVVLAGNDGAPEPFSLRPKLWPAVLEVDQDLPPYSGPEWQLMLPAGAEELDRLILRLIYAEQDIATISAQLSQLPDDIWNLLINRWNAIRTHQRAYIIANPGCIPERLERQRWLSRLWICTPRVLAAAVYQRQRWAINPTEAPAQVQPKKREGRPLRDLTAPTSTGVISGSASALGDTRTQRVVPVQGPDLAEVLAARGARRRPDDPVIDQYQHD